MSPRQGASLLSEKATCKLLISAGRTVLVNLTFDHDLPNPDCKFIFIDTLNLYAYIDPASVAPKNPFNIKGSHFTESIEANTQGNIYTHYYTH